MVVTHLSSPELEAGLGSIRESPRDAGELQLIVRRPQVGERDVLEEARLDPAEGLVGDGWRARIDGQATDEAAPDPDTQLTLMNARTAALVAQHPSRWALAGDQLYVDLDLSADNLPAGTRLAAGSAIIEITAQPHTGCSKFVERFGVDAMKFVNSPTGRSLNLRGIYARVVQAGTVRRGDSLRKL